MIDHVRLGDVTLKVGSGATPRGGANVYRTSGTALIRSQNVLDNAMRLDDVARITDEAAETLRGATVEPEDVLLNITGDSIARCCVVDPAVLPARVSQHVAIIRTTSAVDPRYLQRALVNPSMKQRLITMSSGGTRNALTKAMIEDLLVPCAPMDEQLAIAAVLGALDDKIAANDRCVETARQLMLTLASSAPGEATLVDVAESLKKAMNPAAFEPKVALFSLPAFDDGELPEACQRESIKSNKIALRSPCVLLSKLNPRFPRVWDVRVLPEAMAVASTEFVVLVPRDVSTSLLWASLGQRSVQDELLSKVAGTSGSHQRVKPAEILQLKIPDPQSLELPSQEQITSLGRLCHARRIESLRLRTTRDELLPLLMSGKVRVKDAEKVVEEVT